MKTESFVHLPHRDQSDLFTRALAAYEMACQDILEEIDNDAEAAVLDDALWEATCTLLTTPAPQIAAFALKLQAFRDQEVGRADVGDEMFDRLIDDAKRLGQIAC